MCGLGVRHVGVASCIAADCIHQLVALEGEYQPPIRNDHLIGKG